MYKSHKIIVSSEKWGHALVKLSINEARGEGGFKFWCRWRRPDITISEKIVYVSIFYFKNGISQ